MAGCSRILQLSYHWKLPIDLLFLISLTDLKEYWPDLKLKFETRWELFGAAWVEGVELSV